MTEPPEDLLAEDEPPPAEILRPEGRSRFFLVCDHAAARIPRSLGTLGVSPADLRRHIAWDIGAAAVTRRLAEAFDACAVLQRYSRLVIDCNRAPGHPTSIVAESERTSIPSNREIDARERRRRERAIFVPYHERIAALLDARAAVGHTTVLIAIHSFTPVFLGVARPWQIGVLSHRDRRFAGAVLEGLRADGALVVGDNEPYAIGDQTDYAIPEHAEKRGLLHAEIELRQDLIADEAGQDDWARRLAAILPEAAIRCERG